MRETRLSDEEARLIIKELLGTMEIPQVKSLPKKREMRCCERLKQLMEYRCVRHQGYWGFLWG